MSGVPQLVSGRSQAAVLPKRSALNSGTLVTSLPGNFQIPLGARQCHRTVDRASGHSGQQRLLEFVANERNLRVPGGG